MCGKDFGFEKVQVVADFDLAAGDDLAERDPPAINIFA